VFAGNPLSAAGPVDFRNLIRKETANLAFLEAHHDDLKQAIELAGPNLESSQQTWHRVFRDAERAVLSASHGVFPEFRHLGAAPYAFVLWHQKGRFSLPAAGLLPSWLTATFGDRDGLYPTAARRYRESMNEVAEHARRQDLMDYAGEECIPRSASLIEARLDREDERFSMLQAADGYGPALEATRQHLASAAPDGVDVVASLLRTVEIFEPLTVSEIWRLAYQGERRTFGPGDAVLRQGQPAAALYIVERGTVEVITRQVDDSELPVDRMGPGDVFGEYSLLTGQETSATVRAVDQVVVHTISKSALQPIIEARPEVVVELSVLLANRRGNRQSRSEDYLFGSSEPPNAGMVGRLVSRMRDYLLT
jgi:CRP-like cAMP-binding protein